MSMVVKVLEVIRIVINLVGRIWRMVLQLVISNDKSGSLMNIATLNIYTAFSFILNMSRRSMPTL